MFDFKGRTAIVTGGAMGIGKAVADFLSSAGARVAIADYNFEAAKNTAKELKALGRDVKAFHVDVSEPKMVSDMVNEVKSLWGGIDILINNAGILQDKYVTEIAEEDWDRMIDVHMKGVFLCTRAVVPFMTEKNYGRIVNIASTGARQANYMAGSHYCAAKGGIVAFSRQLGQQFYRKGLDITINNIAPGTINTAMVSMRPPEMIKWIVGQIPALRLGEVEDIGYAVLFLASEWAGYIMGETLDVNGGKYMM